MVVDIRRSPAVTTYKRYTIRQCGRSGGGEEEEEAREIMQTGYACPRSRQDTPNPGDALTTTVKGSIGPIFSFSL